MRQHLCFAILIIFVLAPAAWALDLPLHPGEAQVISAIAATERIDVVAAEMPAWLKNSLIRALAACGVTTAPPGDGTIASKDRPAIHLGYLYDADGHVLALGGNGPWLRNSSLRSLAQLPELRIIHIDHNGFVGRDPRIAEFDGSGFDALADSKLADIRIGLSFSDRGMQQCARIKSLRSFSVAHSRVTDAGIAFFAGHPAIDVFSIAEMGSNRVTGRALAEIAKIPRLTRVGFKECYVTYDNGLGLLTPLRGQLVEIDLSMSIASRVDLDRLQADHPRARIVTIPPAEIVRRHRFIAANLARQAPAELAAALKEALGQ